MLSKGASNALLKTLEEPPDHVVFILATTDPQKVLPTIRSRTQHFEFRLLPADELRGPRPLGHRATPASRSSEAGIAQVLREGGGSARDTLSVLDRIVAAGGVARDDDSVDDLLEALCEVDTGRALVALADATVQGRDPRVLGEQVLDRLRDAFLVRHAGRPVAPDRGRPGRGRRPRRAPARPPPSPGPSRCWATPWSTCARPPTPASPSRWRWSASPGPRPTPPPTPSLARIERLERGRRATASGGSLPRRRPRPSAGAAPSGGSPAARGPQPPGRGPQARGRGHAGSRRARADGRRRAVVPAAAEAVRPRAAARAAGRPEPTPRRRRARRCRPEPPPPTIAAVPDPEPEPEPDPRPEPEPAPVRGPRAGPRARTRARHRPPARRPVPATCPPGTSSPSPGATGC